MIMENIVKETKEELSLLSKKVNLDEEEDDDEEEEEDIDDYLSDPLLQSYSNKPSFIARILAKFNPLFVGLAVVAFLILWSIYRTGVVAQEEYCRWQFDSYQPSAYEKEWASNIKEWQLDVCTKLTEPTHTLISKSLLTRSLELYGINSDVKWAVQDNQPLIDYRQEDDYFSRMSYRRECYLSGDWKKVSGKGQQLIEPLWGLLRDPFDIFCGEEKRLHLDIWPDAGTQSKHHIIPQGYAPYAYHEVDSDSKFRRLQWRSHGTPPWISSFEPMHDAEKLFWTAPRNVLLDLGSAYFASWGESKFAASGQWMYNTFHQRGLKWDKYIAVEVEDLRATEAYNQLPADLVAVYTFMNVPLNVDRGNKMNVIDLLRAISSPNDHVVLKLDIDSANMEIPFAHALRDDKSLGSLVSELFFEHHVDIIEMRPHWGKNLTEDLHDSYELFNALRSNGIRAHSWP